MEKQEELISMGKSIAHKCKGLLLAIKTVAVLLHSKNHSELFSIVDSDVGKSDILATVIVPALQLSYDHLSSEEKICYDPCNLHTATQQKDRGGRLHERSENQTKLLRNEPPFSCSFCYLFFCERIKGKARWLFVRACEARLPVFLCRR
mgnify:CR=1 FL=1